MKYAVVCLTDWLADLMFNVTRQLSHIKAAVFLFVFFFFFFCFFFFFFCFFLFLGFFLLLFFFFSFQIFNAARQLSHIEAAPAAVVLRQQQLCC